MPAGQVGLKGALGFLALQCLIGLAVLLQFNGFAIATGFASIEIVALYPFMKRFSGCRRSCSGSPLRGAA